MLKTRAAIFYPSVRDIHAQNANIDPEHLQALVDDAVHEVRARKRSRRNQHKR